MSVTSRISVRMEAGDASSEASPTEVTFAPASEKAWAMARPMPLVPPGDEHAFSLEVKHELHYAKTARARFHSWVATLLVVWRANVYCGLKITARPG